MNTDRHFYLLAKRWYIRDDLKRDIATIMARYCGLNFECATIEELFAGGLDRMLRLVYNHFDDEIKFVKFMSDMREKHLGISYLKVDLDEAIAMQCLSVLALTKVEDIPFTLGVADYTLLPCRFPSFLPTCFGI